MPARLGLLLYWVGCAAAVLTVAIGVYAFATVDHRLDIFVFFAIVAGLIWAGGRGLRYVLAGR